ncbi:phage tail assembly chaperone [Sphingomonas hankookensis]
MGKLCRQHAAELILYARHLAWLHATPKPPEGSKRAARVEAKPVSRFDRYKADKITPPMPPCTSARVVERWIEIGMVQGGGMAAAALEWGEITAWQRATRMRLSTWEARTIRAMSVAYIGESRRAEAETCPPPWRAPISETERDREEARLRMVLG